MVKWEKTTNEKMLNQAREEIRKSWRCTCEENKDHPRASELFNPDKLPPAFHDPFAGGCALPLEAQRLGLEAYASDLNPVAVLINKAMIEIPPKFAGKPPVNPESRKQKGISSGVWKGAQGLAEDFASYPYLARLTCPSVLADAINDGLRILILEQESFAYADSFDGTEKRYRGLRSGQPVKLSEDTLQGLLVKPDIAASQKNKL
jgi:hypothetical protein